MVPLNDQHFMQAALAAARTYRGHTWPNPSVGCVLVKNGEIISTGCTQMGGRPHAEMDALSKAGDNARGATAYVTLEPCNHAHDDKPVSCCDGLINAGIARIVIGMPDPDPRMMGKSIKKFQTSGIKVDVGCEMAAVHNHHIAHHTRIAWSRPRVTLKLAHSRDGKIGVPTQRVPVSGEDSWQRTFFERSRVDAVMVGINTALADDPQLTDRRLGVSQQPIRIIIDRGATLPLTSRLVQSTDAAPVWLVCSGDSDTTGLEKFGVRAIRATSRGGKVIMPDVLKMLHDIGLTHIFCEGGAQLAQNLLDQKLVDEALMIEGTTTIGPTGIPVPEVKMVLRSEEMVGADQWRIYDSQAVLDLTREFFSDSQRFLAG